MLQDLIQFPWFAKYKPSTSGPIQWNFSTFICITYTKLYYSSKNIKSVATVPLLSLHSIFFSWLSPTGLYRLGTAAIFFTKPSLISTPGWVSHLGPPVEGLQILATYDFLREQLNLVHIRD